MRQAITRAASELCIVLSELSRMSPTASIHPAYALLRIGERFLPSQVQVFSKFSYSSMQLDSKLVIHPYL